MSILVVRTVASMRLLWLSQLGCKMLTGQTSDLPALVLITADMNINTCDLKGEIAL